MGYRDVLINVSSPGLWWLIISVLSVVFSFVF